MIPPTALPPATAPASQTTRVDAYQQDQRSSQGGFGQNFNQALDQFGARAADMTSRINSMVSGQAAPTGSVPSASEIKPLDMTAKPAANTNPMSLMVDSFNFAIQASLLSRAATQFTGSVSTLMKGQ